MATPTAERRSGRPALTLGPVRRVRVQVGYRGSPDGPAHEHFLLDAAVTGEGTGTATRTATGAGTDTEEPAVDEASLLAALEPVLYAGSATPLHYSLHQHRAHTSWGTSPGALELGLLVTTGTRAARPPATARDTVSEAFRELLGMLGRPQPSATSRDTAVSRARREVAAAYALDPDDLFLAAEQHHPSEESWTVGLRTTAGQEYDVLVGFVDGYAGSAWVRHEPRIEISDSVGTE